MSEVESHTSRTCVLWVTTNPEHACAGLLTFCLLSHIPQVSLFVTRPEFVIHLYIFLSCRLVLFETNQTIPFCCYILHTLHNIHEATKSENFLVKSYLLLISEFITLEPQSVHDSGV